MHKGHIISDLSTSFTFWFPLPLRKDLHHLVPIGQEGRWIPKPSRRCWWKENFPAPLRNLNPNHQVSNQSHYWVSYTFTTTAAEFIFLQCWNHSCHTWVPINRLFPSPQLLFTNCYKWYISILTHLTKKSNDDEMMMMMIIIIIKYIPMELTLHVYCNQYDQKKTQWHMHVEFWSIVTNKCSFLNMYRKTTSTWQSTLRLFPNLINKGAFWNKNHKILHFWWLCGL
jgi:hypothetical protein